MRARFWALAPGLRPRDRFRSAGLSSPVVTVAAPKANHMTSVCWLALRGRGFKLRSAEIPGGARDLNSVDRNLTKLGAPATEGKPTNTRSWSAKLGLKT